MIFIYLFFLHFVADFLLQSRKMVKEKSKKVTFLIQHCSIQLIVFFLGLLPIYGSQAIEFAAQNAAIHGVIDWHIWRLYVASVLWLS